MRILTWNVNGIKTLIHYAPWNELKPKTHESILQALEADIICIQETKITRAQLDKTLACMNSYDSFYSFYRPTKGIHGTSIYTLRSSLIPLKAEEGLSNSLLPSSLLNEERIGGYPSCVEMDLDFNRIKELDSEGRTTVIDCGMFVLINLYCPNLTNESRIPFKNNFNKLVDQRTKELIKLGREVIVLGDLNIYRAAIDCAEPEKRIELEQQENWEEENEPRKWLNDFVKPLEEGGIMIDICREFHKDRAKMYTCWETKIDARTSNYGARIDYILITPGLLPWVKDSNILPQVVGSDHCPVYLDLHEELEIEGKGTVKLWDLMNPTRSKIISTNDDGIEVEVGDNEMLAPGFASRFYDEFSGKQKLLSNFFVKKEVGISTSASNGGSVASGSGSKASAVSTSSAAPTTSNEQSTATSTSQSQSSSQPIIKSTTSMPTSTLAPRSSLFADYVSLPSTSTENSKGKGKGKAKAKEIPESTSQTISNFFKAPTVPLTSSKIKSIKKTKSSTSSKAASNIQPRRSPSLPLPNSNSTFNDIITITDDESEQEELSVNASASTSSTRSIQRGPSKELDDDFLSGLQPDDFEASYSSQPTASSSTNTFSSNPSSSSTWSNIFAPKPIPNCIDHNEPTKLWTVNKSGINKGRKFYSCNRPVGEGYDKGQRGKVNKEFRCNFFEWDTVVKRPASVTPGGQNKKQKK